MGFASVERRRERKGTLLRNRDRVLVLSGDGSRDRAVIKSTRTLELHHNNGVSSIIISAWNSRPWSNSEFQKNSHVPNLPPTLRGRSGRSGGRGRGRSQAPGVCLPVPASRGGGGSRQRRRDLRGSRGRRERILRQWHISQAPLRSPPEQPRAAQNEGARR